MRKNKAPVYRPGFRGRLSARQRDEICMGAILTQNTNWGNVERSLVELHRAGLWDWAAIAATPARKLERWIRSSGYFRQKAKKLKIFARYALGRSPARWFSRADLLALWGIGPETADSMLLYAGAKNAFVIDAYTLRIGKRLGWFNHQSYEGAQKFLTSYLPGSTRLYAEFHAVIVELAKRHCRVKPSCPGCPLLELCPHGQKILS